MSYRVRQLIYEEDILLYNNLSERVFYSLSEAKEFICFAKSLDKAYYPKFTVRYTIVEVDSYEKKI